MDTIVDNSGQRLAERIKNERETRGWSAADLAARSGVSRAMIAKVESGQSSPTAMLLGKLSGAFGLTLSGLLARAEAGGHLRLVRKQDQPVWRDPETSYVRRQIFPVAGSDFPVDLVRVELPAGAIVDYPATAYAFIRQLIWVLEGELVFAEGAHEHHLQAEDGLELGPPQDCRFKNCSGKACTYIVLVLRQRAKG